MRKADGLPCPEYLLQEVADVHACLPLFHPVMTSTGKQPHAVEAAHVLSFFVHPVLEVMQDVDSGEVSLNLLGLRQRSHSLTVALAQCSESLRNMAVSSALEASLPHSLSLSLCKS